MAHESTTLDSASGQHRDLIVVGASSGGLAALEELVTHLPGDLPAAVAVVWHTGHGESGFLARFLGRAGKLPARIAEQGDPVRTGEIAIAPRDCHLLVEPAGYRLSHGPRENRCRPAVDVLFRSAAVSYRSRAMGVVLTGQLYDGAAGLSAIQTCGGLAFAQDPAEAAYPEMPESAIASTPVDRVASVPKLAELLTRYAGTPAPEAPPVPQRLVQENLLATGHTSIQREESLGELTPYGCPECGGPLWEMDSPPQRFRCHVGHAFSTPALLAEQRAATEQALWAATRVMEERERMLQGLQKRLGNGEGSSLDARAAEVSRHKELILNLISELGPGAGEMPPAPVVAREGGPALESEDRERARRPPPQGAPS